MDIQEKQALIAEIERFKEEAMKMHIVKVLADSYTNTNLFDHIILEDEGNKVWWMKTQAYELWCFWQAAQAVPEGFVLIKESDRDREICELIDERDHLENQAEQLKDKLQNLYAVDFGEHSNCNFPFQNAIDFDDSNLVLVPKEPTEKMIDAGHDFCKLNIVTPLGFYKAMIEAQEQKG